MDQAPKIVDSQLTTEEDSDTESIASIPQIAAEEVPDTETMDGLVPNAFLTWDVMQHLIPFLSQDTIEQTAALKTVCTLWNGKVKEEESLWDALECNMLRSDQYVRTFWGNMPNYVKNVRATIVIRNIGHTQSCPLNLCLLDQKPIKSLVLLVASSAGVNQVASVFTAVAPGAAMKPPIELVLGGEPACRRVTWRTDILANFPPISKLCLSRFSGPFAQHPSLARIRSLQLKPSMNMHIFSILPLIPDLESLVIDGEYTSRTIAGNFTVTLNKLHTLKTAYLSPGLDHLNLPVLKTLTIEEMRNSPTKSQGKPSSFIKNHPSIEILEFGGYFVKLVDINTVAPNLKKLVWMTYRAREFNSLLLPLFPNLTELVIHDPTFKLNKWQFEALVNARCLKGCQGRVLKLRIQTPQWKDGQDGWWNTELYKLAKKTNEFLGHENDPCCFIKGKEMNAPKCIEFVMQWD